MVFFSRNVGQITPQIIYLDNLKYFLDQSIQEKFYLILNTEALTVWISDRYDSRSGDGFCVGGPDDGGPSPWAKIVSLCR